MGDKGLSVDPAEARAVPANDRVFVYDPTSERFARRMARRGARRAQAPGDLLGLEYEFEVVEASERLDFRDLIDEVVGAAERRWFPFDPHARFLASGAVVTCDETEAELAIAPIPRRPGFATVAADELLARRGELVAAIRQFNETTGRSIDMRGYSTHVNAYCPPARLAEIAHRFARTAAPAAMLMLDLATSPGALVRPRGNRLEIAGEYVGGRDDLRAAIVLFLAAMLATTDNVPLPILGGRILPASGRTGWFVDRAAYGDDLYLEGRMARLALSGGGTILAGTLLGDVWEASRPYVEAIATREELALVDETVTGERPLPLEQMSSDEEELAPLVEIKDFASILRERHRDTVAIRPVSVSWDAATFEVSTPYRSFYAHVAREAYASFARMFERGDLDRAFVRYARRPFRDRVLELGTTKAGLFDAMEMAETTASEHRVVVKMPAEAMLVPPRPRRVAVRKVAFAIAAAAMLGGGTAVALTAMPSSKPAPLAVAPMKQGPQTQFAPKPSAKPVPKQAPTVSPSVLGLHQRAPSAPRNTQVREPAPAPRPTNPAPKPKPKPKPPAPPPRPPNQSYPISITGSASCSVGTSILNFVVRNANDAPGIVEIFVQYNRQQVPLGSSPDYPTHSYQGRASAPATPGGNHRWQVTVRDASGRAPLTKDFFDNC